MEKLKPYERCPKCGRFIKRELFNFIRHTFHECPEQQLFVYSINGSILTKRKILYGNQKTTNHWNSRMED